MPVALVVSLPLIMAAVLIASGIAKLRSPDDLQGWRDLGVPEGLRREWLLRLHPWGEIVLGVALAVLGSVLGVIAGVIAVVLMAAYTVLIALVLRRTPDASCACFGEPAPVTRWTLVRNVWLTVVAVAAAVMVWATPLWGGAVRSAFGPAAWVVLAVAVGAVTVFVVVRHESVDAAAAASASAAPVAASAGAASGASGADDELDYVRTRTPGAPVTLADGTVISLRHLAAAKPILMLSVSEWCGSCEPVIEQLDHYRELLPEVDVRFLLQSKPGESRLSSAAEPQTLHDPERYVADSIMDRMPTPTAVLLGIDGMLAGGPEIGKDAIDSFVDDIYESLHGVRPAS